MTNGLNCKFKVLSVNYAPNDFFDLKVGKVYTVKNGTFKDDNAESESCFPLYTVLETPQDLIDYLSADFNGYCYSNSKATILIL